MGKLVAIETFERFLLLLNDNQILDTSLIFILDTGLFYTHGILFNSVSYGAINNDTVTLNVGGTSKTLSLASHTHSNYYAKNADLDIDDYKIVSGSAPLLYYEDDVVKVGSTSTPTYLHGTLKAIRGDNTYTILDTGNTSIENKTISGVSMSNVATFKYGNSNFQLDYVKRENTIIALDTLASYTNMGTTNENSKFYGFMTMYTDGRAIDPKFAQIRINIDDNILEFRSSSNRNWTGLLLGGAYKNITINGTTYSLVTKSNSLPTLYIPTSLGNGGQYLSVADDGGSLVWRTVTIPEIVANSKTQNGVVLKGQGNPNKVWMTDADGAPNWRDLNVNSILAAATTTTLGGIKVQSINTNAVTPNTGTESSGRYYGVRIDANELAYVNIPWQDTWIAWAGATTTADGTSGYMPAPTSALRNKFLRGDGSWVSLNNYSLPTASNTTLGGVKTGAAITDVTGYTAVAIKDGIIYYKDTNTTYSFSNLLFLQTSGTNLMTYNSQAVRTVLAGSNITFTHSNNVLTIAAKDTTYSTVSKTAAGLCPTLPNETTTTKYLRLDGTWLTPPDNNTWKAANASQEGYVPKSTANKILRANGNGALYWGDDANTTYTFYNLQFQNSKGTTVDTYKPTTSPTKTLKAGSNVTISAASNVITIASTNTWNAMTGATSSANGTVGYVNAAPPKNGYNTKFLRADGTWSVPAYPTKSSWNYDDKYVSSLTTSGNSLRWVKNGSNNDITIPYATSAGSASSATYASSYLANRQTIGSSSQNHAQALQSYFNSYKSSIPRNCLTANYSGAHSNGSLYFGYFLSGYDSSPYGGFYVCHYGTPYYVGISNGSYSEQQIITSSSIGSQSVNYASSAGSVAWSNVSSKPATATRWPAWSEITSKPTTLSGYGITDGLYSTQVSVAQTDLTYAKNASKTIRRGFVYNTSGTEWSYLFGFTSGTNSSTGYPNYGAVYKFGYTDRYIRVLRVNGGGTWQSTDWEKIYAGYADSAGSVAWSNVSSKPATATRWPSWSEVTSKPSSFTPSSHDHTKILFIDDRDTVENPTNVAGKNGIEIHFKNKSKSSIPSSGTWTAIVMLDGYSDTSGGYPMELGFSMSDLSESRPLYLRTPKSATEWGSWRTILDSGNSSVSKSGETLTVKINGTSQSLTNTNTTYSGSSTVTLSGTTFSLTKANVTTALGYTPPTTNSTYNFSGTTFYSGNSGNAEHNCNNAVKNGNYYYTSNGPSGLGNSTSDGALYVQSYSDSWVGQIAQDYRNGRLWVRGRNNGSWKSWVRIANYNEIPSSLPANGGNADTVDNQHFKWSNDSNSPTYLWAANSSGTAFLASRANMSVNYANSAGSVAWSNVSSKPAAAGNATTPVYWNGSGFTKCTAYGSASVNYATSAGNADTVDSQHFKWSNDSNSPTYLWAANSSGTAFLCARGSMSVNYASSAGSVAWGNISSKPFNWSGLGGQPTWLWGSNDGSNYYVWNPSNFSVNYASSAGYANSCGSFSGAWAIEGGNEVNLIPSSFGYNRLWFNYTAKGGSHVNLDSNYFGDAHTGTVNCYAASFGNSSDIRYKQIIEYVDLSLEQVAYAPIFKFYWTNKSDSKLHAGSSALYWLGVVRELVHYDDYIDLYFLNYGETALISAVTVAKETLNLKNIVLLLQSENEQLKSRISMLESTVRLLTES